jgi:DNA-binding NarL/FixJ family response regulator
MSHRLLVVDDDPHLLRALSMSLRVDGYTVRTARNGAEALVSLAEFTPDLVITDIRMPGMDGHQLVQQLRNSPRTNLLPIIFLTAKDDISDRVAGLKAGIDYYLTKPFEAEELLAIISNILQRVARTHSEIARLVDTTKNDAGTSIPDEDLTKAEERVAIAVSRGLSNKEIAAELNISIRTVETHVRRILSKKGFSNRVEIARYVLERTSQDQS